MPICSRASAGVGGKGVPVMEETRGNTWFQKELKDLQNQRIWAMEPILQQFLQQKGG